MRIRTNNVIPLRRRGMAGLNSDTEVNAIWQSTFSMFPDPARMKSYIKAANITDLNSRLLGQIDSFLMPVPDAGALAVNYSVPNAPAIKYPYGDVVIPDAQTWVHVDFDNENGGFKPISVPVYAVNWLGGLIGGSKGFPIPGGAWSYDPNNENQAYFIDFAAKFWAGKTPLPLYNPAYMIDNSKYYWDSTFGLWTPIQNMNTHNGGDTIGAAFMIIIGAMAGAAISAVSEANAAAAASAATSETATTATAATASDTSAIDIASEGGLPDYASIPAYEAPPPVDTSVIDIASEGGAPSAPVYEAPPPADTSAIDIASEGGAPSAPSYEAPPPADTSAVDIASEGGAPSAPSTAESGLTPPNPSAPPASTATTNAAYEPPPAESITTQTEPLSPSDIASEGGAPDYSNLPSSDYELPPSIDTPSLPNSGSPFGSGWSSLLKPIGSLITTALVKGGTAKPPVSYAYSPLTQQSPVGATGQGLINNGTGAPTSDIVGKPINWWWLLVAGAGLYAVTKKKE